MVRNPRNETCKILIAADSERQKTRLLEYLSVIGYRANCTSATELLKNQSNQNFTAPDCLVLALDHKNFNHQVQLAIEYAKRNTCQILYSIDPRDIKNLKSAEETQGVPYVLNTCGPHELELGLEVLRLRGALDVYARDERREHWALEALSYMSQRADTRESTLDGIVGIVATALDAACCIMKKDAITNSYHDVAFAGAEPDDIKKLTQRASKAKFANEALPEHIAETSLKRPKLWEPAAKLVTPIVYRATLPAFVCVWSNHPRQFSEAERTLVAVAAAYSGMAMSTSFHENLS